jgi:hypothetical protein
MIDGQRQTERDNQRNRLPPERIETIIIALLAAASHSDRRRPSHPD